MNLHANSTIGTSPLLFNVTEFVFLLLFFLSQNMYVYIRVFKYNYVCFSLEYSKTLGTYPSACRPRNSKKKSHHDLITYRSLSNMPIISRHVSLLKGDQLPFIKACCSSCAVIFPERSWSTVCQNKRAKCAPRQRSLSRLTIKTKGRVCTKTKKS